MRLNNLTPSQIENIQNIVEGSSHDSKELSSQMTQLSKEIQSFETTVKTGIPQIGKSLEPTLKHAMSHIGKR